MSSPQKIKCGPWDWPAPPSIIAKQRREQQQTIGVLRLRSNDARRPSGKSAIRFRRGEPIPENAASYLIVNCKISGIDKLRACDAIDAADRTTASLTDLGLMQKVDDPSDLFLIWSVDNVERAGRAPGETCLGSIEPPEAHYWTRWRGGARSQAARLGAKAGPG